MSLYIIEDRYGALRDSSVNYNYAKSLQQSRYPSCHIVELVPANPKVQVSQEEADMLERAKDPTNYGFRILYDYANQHGGYLLGNKEFESHLMRAYVNGYTVAKEKKYNVKVPQNWSGDDKHYWSKEQDGSLTWACLINKDYMIPTYQFTLTEIEHYDLQDFEKFEVTDDDE